MRLARGQAILHSYHRIPVELSSYETHYDFMFKTFRYACWFF